MKCAFAWVAISGLAVAGILASAAGFVHLNQAMKRSQDLYIVDTVGSQIESDLEYNTQESRRAFLYALTLSDPNQQLPYIDSARAADAKVRALAGRFHSLRPPAEIRVAVEAFESSWKVYAGARDEIVARILTGDSRGALNFDQGRGNLAFQSALEQLHGLKRALEDHAREQSLLVNRTLSECILGLAFFIGATALIVFALVHAIRRRAAAGNSLQISHRELELAREMDRRKMEVLEMIGAHAPLARTLTAVAEMAVGGRAGVGAAIWSAAGNMLLYHVSSGLSEELRDRLRSRSFELQGGRLDASAGAALPELAARAGFDLQSIPLWNGAKDTIGLLALLTPRGEGTAAADSGAAPPEWSPVVQLASLAIENSLLYERLAFHAQHDVLTGLPNRLLFQDRVQQAIRLAQRNRKKLAVLWFDVDRLKQINDTCGHRTGDELLCEVGRRLRHSIRESDTAARIGGDEFVVLIADLDSAADADVVMEKILKTLRLPVSLSGQTVSLSASAGIGIYPEHGTDPAALMRSADLAMYKAKQAGRDGYRVFRSEFGDSMGRSVRIEHELKTALGEKQFSLEYQPMIDKHDQLAGFEALLRWTNPALGRVSPAEFIPVAEEMGLISRIGEWVTRQACRDGARWLAAGIGVPRIAVNASGLQFADKNFPAMVQAALAESGFPPSKLEIEVTETALVNNLEEAIEQISQLRSLGIKFAIDDFGTGYSSLNQLRTLPVDYVKVDRSFIQDLQEPRGDSTALVRGIIGLAHNLQLLVVAEGVETEKQLSVLRSLDCDVSQGFFLYRPLPPEAAEELMKNYPARLAPLEPVAA